MSKKTCSCCDRIVCAMPARDRAERDARRKAREAKEREARASSLPANVHAEDGSCCPVELNEECGCSSSPTDCDDCVRFFALHPAAL